MIYIVGTCSKLCGDNLQRSTKQNGLSEQRAVQ